MKVAELKRMLDQMPDDLPVIVKAWTDGEWYEASDVQIYETEHELQCRID